MQVRRVDVFTFYYGIFANDKAFSSHLISFNHYRVVAGADDGIEEIEGGGVILKCLQTRTGIKFVLT